MNSNYAQISEQITENERSFIEIFEETKDGKSLLQPLKGKTDLINLCGYVSLMSKVTIAALAAFQKHQWRQFDALVGENACQLRAAKIKDLADIYLNSQEWQQEINEACEQALTILQQLPAIKKQIEKKFPSGKEFKAAYGISTSSREVCEKEKWQILQRVSDNVRFVVESYLLTQTKTLVSREDCFYQKFDVTDAENLARFNDSLDGQATDEKNQLVGNKKLRELVSLLQCDLASLSIDYLQKEVCHLRESAINQFAHKE
jgi:hypothetical protein